MNDVIAVAIVSSASSLIGAAIGAVTTFKVSRRSAETAIATAEGQNEVELAKVGAENERLRDQFAEEERRNRQATYHRALTALQLIHGIDDRDERSEAVWKEWRESRAGVHIFGSEEAMSTIDEVQQVLKRRPPDDDDQTKWRLDLNGSIYEFIAALRIDVRKNRAP